MTPTGPHHLEPIAHLVPELKALLTEKQWDLLKELLEELSPLDLADSWYQFSKEDQIRLFKLMDPKAALILFQGLNVDDQTFLVKSLEDASVANVLENISAGDMAGIFHKLSPKAVRKMATLVKTEAAVERIKQVMEHPKGKAGALMHPEFIRLQPRTIARTALNIVQSCTRPDKPWLLRSLFVTSPEGTLIGSVQIESLLTAPPDALLQDFMTSVEPFKLSPEMDQERASALFSKYNLLSAPVVDAEDRPLGVVFIDDILESVQKEATDDMQKIGGMEALQRPYLQVDFFWMLRKRAGWLAALFIGEMLTASAMTHFEAQIARAVVLALFVPLIISSGGNSGSQAATLIIRAMALGEVRLRDWWQVVYREIGMGLCLGLILAVIGFIRIIIWQQIFHIYGDYYFLVALSVSLSLIGIVMWGSLAGSVLPLVLKKLGFDPASASAPFVATLVDVSGILIYFSISALLLHGTLL